MLVDDLVADGPQNGAWMRMKVNGGVGFVDPVDSPCDVPYYATDWLGDQRAALRPVLAA
jgi:hypothetical protein